jgi:hypothetical protein
MKEAYPEAVDAAVCAVKEGKVSAPSFSREWSDLHAPIVGTHSSQVMPINKVSTAVGTASLLDTFI